LFLRDTREKCFLQEKKEKNVFKIFANIKIIDFNHTCYIKHVWKSVPFGTSRSRTVRFGRNKELVLTNKQKQFCKKLLFLMDIPQGFAVIFSHRRVYVEREGRTPFLLPKVKVEFRHLFSLQKRFSLFFRLFKIIFRLFYFYQY
jgi:hypothetical protein